MTQDGIVSRFIENAGKVAAYPQQVGDIAEMNSALEEILASAKAVFNPRATELERSVTAGGDRSQDDYMQADACVQEATAAIAETGSVVSASANGKTVQAGLVPSHHIAIVAKENIFATLDDYFDSIGKTPPTNITFETGPSRTADIELTLTIGVHGPEKLSIVVL